jgi:transposase
VNVEIARLFGVSQATVNAWRARYAERGLAALAGQKRSGRKRSVDHRRISATGRRVCKASFRLRVLNFRSQTLSVADG